jgi:hypothetical protein
MRNLGLIEERLPKCQSSFETVREGRGHTANPLRADTTPFVRPATVPSVKSEMILVTGLDWVVRRLLTSSRTLPISNHSIVCI